MHILLVKTSSLGDIVHTLPALTDLQQARPEVRVDWAVEEAFAEIPGWHPAVAAVIPVALRRWRRRPLQARASGEWQRCRAALRAQAYDAVIDAQGLLKSAWVACCARGPRIGLDWQSAREPLASLSYHQRVNIPRRLHAVERTRRLLAQALGYPQPVEAPRFAIAPHFAPRAATIRTVVVLHGTSRSDKEWPEPHWQALLQSLCRDGLSPLLPWGNTVERARAERLATACSGITVLPQQSLTQLAQVLRNAALVVAVDTGLGHLAAALGTACVTLYGPTDPALIGTVGSAQQHLRAPRGDLTQLSSDCVYAAVTNALASTATDACISPS